MVNNNPFPKAFWEAKYENENYVYGENPNEFLKENLSHLRPGKILFPAEGEGRNAVFAAKTGWDVHAFDQSMNGQKKALDLALKNKVNINYQLGELENTPYEDNSFDAIALIYAHFNDNVRPQYHKLLSTYLRPGGVIILEAFSKNHLELRQKNEKVGGPNDINMLYSIEDIKSDFLNFEMLKLEETEIQLNEGFGHSGIGSVIRFIGKKK